MRDITGDAYGPGFWPQTPSGRGAITADLGGALLFSANDGAHGRELWGVHTESAVYGEVARVHLPLVGQ